MVTFIEKVICSLVVKLLVVNTGAVEPGCTFNPCEAVSGYCKNAGQCVFNETECIAACVCPDAFTGTQCEVFNSKSEPTSNVFNLLKCLVDPCSFQLASISCQNGGTCTRNPGSCEFKCACASGYMGKRCESEISSNTTCRTSGLSCIHGTCVINDKQNSQEKEAEICECDKGWAGSHCDIRHIQNKPVLTETSSSNGMPFVGPETSPSFNSCTANYKDRSKSERTCNGMFRGRECVYGKCQKDIEYGDNWRGYKYGCECDIGAQGTYCEYRCCLNCGENGTCAIYEYPNTTSIQFCDCKQNYVGEKCEIFVPDPVRLQLQENTWYLYVVGACAVTFVLLVIMAVVVPYLMWKHRVILIMKIVHYFKPYEDDDEREWDAFVSYKADEVDERFVIHTLYPKLEKELGYKLCLHFRDFVPGETIANNIINAVEGSRRTILILTPRFVESEFTRFEYEKAQQEMLRRKHRIIPLVLEDISSVTDTMDKTLKNILDSVTYLEWPESSNDSSKKLDKFWKRLHLSMPKKKESSTSLSAISSVTSGAIKSNSDNFIKLSDSYDDRKVCYHTYPDQLTPSVMKFSDLPAIWSTVQRSYSEGSEDTQYTEISEIDESLDNMIPTLSEEDEASLSC